MASRVRLTRRCACCRWLLLVTALTQCSSGQDFRAKDWQFPRPLRVCTASIDDFGARCNGSPVPEWEVEGQRWCANGRDFCGYDVDVWTEVAARLDLQKGRDYVHVCFGELGFGPMIDDLAREDFRRPSNESAQLSRFHPPDEYLCDVGVSALTANTERWARGIEFSRATLRSNLAIMVLAPLLQRGTWAFFAPLAVSAWMMLLGTTLILPFFVFFFEAIFSKHCIYRDQNGDLNVWFGLKEALWHGIAQSLSIDVFRVQSIPARIVTAAYAFLVLIITHTYTANLAAFLTVKQLDTSIQTVEDLRGLAVVTVPTYVGRLYANHLVVASAGDGWDHNTMEKKLRTGEYQAVISDAMQLVAKTNSDEECHLHLLADRIEPFDIAFAYAKGFAYPQLIQAIDEVMIRVQEDGTLTKLEERNSYPEASCQDESEFAETNQVDLKSLIGLWYILVGFLGAALLAGLFEYCLWRRAKPHKYQAMKDRASTLSHSLVSGPSTLLRTMVHSRSMLRVPSLLSRNGSNSWRSPLQRQQSSTGSDAPPTFRSTSFLKGSEPKLQPLARAGSGTPQYPPSITEEPPSTHVRSSHNPVAMLTKPTLARNRFRPPSVPTESLVDLVSAQATTALPPSHPVAAAAEVVDGDSLPSMASVFAERGGAQTGASSGAGLSLMSTTPGSRALHIFQNLPSCVESAASMTTATGSGLASCDTQQLLAHDEGGCESQVSVSQSLIKKSLEVDKGTACGSGSEGQEAGHSPNGHVTPDSERTDPKRDSAAAEHKDETRDSSDTDKTNQNDREDGSKEGSKGSSPDDSPVAEKGGHCTSSAATMKHSRVPERPPLPVLRPGAKGSQGTLLALADIMRGGLAPEADRSSAGSTQRGARSPDCASYRAELLQLRDVVQALSSHLDSMLTAAGAGALVTPAAGTGASSSNSGSGGGGNRKSVQAPAAPGAPNGVQPSPLASNMLV